MPRRWGNARPQEILRLVTKAARLTLLVVGVTTLARRLGLAADAAYGEYLAAEGVTSHGANAANASIPPLRSLRYEELVTALKVYREAPGRTLPCNAWRDRSGQDERVPHRAALAFRPRYVSLRRAAARGARAHSASPRPRGFDLMEPLVLENAPP